MPAEDFRFVAFAASLLHWLDVQGARKGEENKVADAELDVFAGVVGMVEVVADDVAVVRYLAEAS
jgi:hypothetical protein